MSLALYFLFCEQAEGLDEQLPQLGEEELNPQTGARSQEFHQSIEEIDEEE